MPNFSGILIFMDVVAGVKNKSSITGSLIFASLSFANQIINIPLCTEVIASAYNIRSLVTITIPYQFQQVDEEVAVLTQFIVSRTAEISKLLETSSRCVTSINHIRHVRSEDKWCSIPVVIATYKQ